MAVQLDNDGASMLRKKIEALGVGVHTAKATTEIASTDDGLVLRFADGEAPETDLVVFSAGIRPQDALARSSGLAIGERGGICIDDGCQTSDRDVFAIGECALWEGKSLDWLPRATRWHGRRRAVGRIKPSPWSVQKIQGVLDAAFAPIGQGDGLLFDRDATLTLDIHVIEDLVLKIARIDHTGKLDQTVRQGRLAVVNMGDDTEITDVFHNQYNDKINR